MRRFSIAAMMIVVLVCGVAVAALRDASDTWAGVMLLLTLLLLGISILGAIERRDTRRAFWRGFAIFGWIHLLIAFAPWMPATFRGPTTRLLVYMHERIAPPAQIFMPPATPTSGLPSASSTGAPPPNWGMIVDGATPPIYLMVGGANREQFLQVGQCLFTLLAALTGGWLGRWFHRTSEAT